jgi:shikimate kinase
MTPLIVLIGPPGAGKSAVGEALARKLGLSFADTDQIIEVEQGRSISDIFVENGEPYFREIERKVCLSSFDSVTGVLALGGGAVLDSETQAALVKSASEIIFLDVSLKVVAPRIGFNRDRPLLMNNPRQKWQELMDARRPVYESLATIVYPVEGQSVNQIVNALLEKVERR